MDELQRYIEHLQRQMRTEWADTVLNRHSGTDRGISDEKLQKVAADVGGGHELAQEAAKYLSSESHTDSDYDSPVARRIFSPLLEKVLSAAAKLGLGLSREVILANSTDAHPTSSSVPSSHKHLLFAGAGTYAFCNYWAKVVANVALACNEEFGGVAMTRSRLRRLWHRDVDLIATPLRLAVYCRLLGSVIGFGRLPTTPAVTGFRVELLSAMETFAVAHEIGHCFLEEREPNRPQSANDELLCDAYGFAITRSIGSTSDNWSMTSGAAAYTFLRAASVSLPNPSPKGNSSHPASEVRAAAVFELATAGMSRRRGGPIRRYLREIDALFAEIERHCQMVVLPE